MAKLGVVGVCLLTLAVCCNAHLCLLSPPQRGPALSMTDLNNKASALCARTKGPCGTESTSQNVITVQSGYFQVMFQKNLNHYNASLSSHGEFRISLLGEDSKHDLGSIPDTATPSLYLYTVVVKLSPPKIRELMNKNVQLQVVYVTKNPNAPEKFYQCADIKISD